MNISCCCCDEKEDLQSFEDEIFCQSCLEEELNCLQENGEFCSAHRRELESKIKIIN